MNMYQKREERRLKKMNENNGEEKLTKVGINWYPGHMVKAQNDIKANLKLIDIVVEVLDARIPMSSRNPKIDELAKDKARIVILNKADLADNDNLESWVKYFKEKGYECIITDTTKSSNITNIKKTISSLGKKIYDNKYKDKNIKINHIYRVLIAGIPNVGKSTIINKLANKNVVDVGNKPGVTKKKQWIRIGDNIELLDTPGLLWPNLDDNNAGLKLAFTGNIKQEILDTEEIACEALKFILNSDKYTKLLSIKYSLNDMDLEKETYDLLEEIGKKRGCIVSGGNVDMQKASKMFVDDLKNGKIGKISFDTIN